MRAGFLGGSKRATPLQAVRKHPASDDVVPTATPAVESPATQRSTEPVVLTEEQWNRNFEQCLQLLHGPNDESRFVGLLVASKLLPQGGDVALQRVQQAVGWDFLQRMLLPLVQAASRPASSRVAVTEEQAQQQQMCAGVGLSVLAAMCRFPEVASSPQLQSLIPALVQLVAAGSTQQLLQGKVTHAVSSSSICYDSSYASHADWAAVEDAIECLLAACSVPSHSTAIPLATANSSSEGVAAAPQSNSVLQDAADQATLQDSTLQEGQHRGHTSVHPAPTEAALKAVIQHGGIRIITAMLGGLLASAPQHKWQSSNLGVANAWRLPVLGVRLLCLLQPAQARTSCTDHDPTALNLVVVLCHFLGLPEILNSSTAAAAATAARKASAAARAQQLQQLQQGPSSDSNTADLSGGCDELGALEPEPSSGQGSMGTNQTVAGNGVMDNDAASTPATSSTHAVQKAASLAVAEDATVLQLQSLHALLLLLPTVLNVQEGSSTAMTLLDAVALSEAMPKHQKTQEAVSLAAVGWGAAARRGLGWLLRGQSLGEELRHAALQACSFLVRVLGSGWLFGGDTQKPGSPTLAVVLAEVLQVELGLLLRDIMHANAQVVSHAAQPEPRSKLLQELEQRREQLEQHGQQAVQSAPLLSISYTPPAAAHSAAANMPPNGSYTVGQRAAERLPTVLGLLEALIEGLALVSQAEADDSMEVEASASLQQYRQHVPLVPLQVQEQLMMSVGASVQLVVQFLHSVQEQLHTPSTAAMNGNHDAAIDSYDRGSCPPAPELLLACTRLLGRYLAEAPDAVKDEVHAILPVLLLAHPYAPPRPNSGVASTQQTSADSSQQDMSNLQELAVQFLLPGLLQASWGAQPAARKLHQMFRLQPALPACLGKALGRALQRARQVFLQPSIGAGSATALDTAGLQQQQVQQQGQQRQVQQQGQQQQQAVLLQAERQAADMCMLLLNIIGQPSESLSSMQHSVIHALVPVESSLASWAQARLLSQPELNQPGPLRSMQQLQQLLQALSERALLPRTVLCTAALAAVMLQAHVGGHSSSHAASGTKSAETDAQLLCQFVVLAAQVGFALAVAVVVEVRQPGSLSHIQNGAQYAQPASAVQLGADGAPVAVSVQDVLEDIEGDGESCWESITLVMAACMHTSPQLQAAAQALQLADWQAASAQDAASAGHDLISQAKNEVSMQSMGWQLLAQSLPS